MVTYTIVKHAAENHWGHFFSENPTDGVGLFQSAHNSFLGLSLNVLPEYTDLKAAEEACAQMNNIHLIGGYAVCRVIPEPIPNVL
jgi:hypothetical protein